MTTALLGGLLGLTLALGLLVTVRSAPPLRPVRLVDRLAPYLPDAPAPSKLLAVPGARSMPFVVAGRLFGPVLGELARWVDRTLGGAASVRRRLTGLRADNTTTVEEFRLEQVLWGAVAMVAAAVGTVALGALGGFIAPLLVIAVALGGFVGGVLGRDWYLSRQVQQREDAIMAEFPVVADLLALAVVAGEAPTDALQRVCRLTAGGQIAADLDVALARARAGQSLTVALTSVAESSTFEPFARFIDGLVIAIERGTPLADVLRAQAVDVREASKRALLEAGGRKEISMMVPVVFLILPVTVLFALFPGLLTLTQLAR